MSDAAEYTFVPWVREGLRPTDGEGDGWSVGVEVSVKGDGPTGAETRDASVDLSLYGPGEVTGIDRQQVVRTEPTPGTSDFPPNGFPLVEFDEPTLPWLFTPGRPDDDGRLRPWCCLLTVEKTEGVSLQTGTDGPAAVLDVRDPASPGEHLPDLAESWAWAHAQVVGADDAGAALDADRSTTTLARLLSPRRLAPDTDYLACVVPAYEPGRLAGLGKEPYERTDDGTLVRSFDDAWDVSKPPGRLRLPVYYHWEFSTGKAGDFESLVRRLDPSVLEDVGVRTVDASDPGPDALASPGETVTVEGALRSANLSPDTYAESLRTDLTDILDGASALAPESAVPGDADDDRILGPPIYGQWPPAVEKVPAETAEPAWLRDLNADPRYRVPAAYGTEVVRDRQEALMAEAWRQVGEIREANRLLRHARLSRAASQPIHDALGDLPPAALLSVTEPAHGRTTDGDGTSIAARVDDSALPSALLSPAFRRITRPGGPLARRLGGLRRERIVEGANDGRIEPGDDGGPPTGAQVIDEGLAGTLCSAARERDQGSDDWTLLGPTPDAPLDEAVDAVRRRCRETRERTEAAAERIEDRDATAELGVLLEVLFPICGEGDWDSELDDLAAAIEDGDWTAVRSALDGLDRWLGQAEDSHGRLADLATSNGALDDALTDDPGITPAVEALLDAVTILRVRLLLAGLFAHTCTTARRALRDIARGGEESLAAVADLRTLCALLCGDDGLLGALRDAARAGDTRRVRRVVAAMGQVVATADSRLARLRDRADVEEGPTATLVSACATIEGYVRVLRRRLADAPRDPAAAAVGPRVCPRSTPDPAPSLDLRATADAVMAATDPAITVPNRIAGRLDGLPLAERDDPLAEIMAQPEFDEPMYGALRDLGQEKLVPGVGEIPLDSVGVLETNPAFVESYMLGLSHEMARELRWREYPTDLRGTYFRQFWDPEGRDPPLSAEAKRDVDYVHRWDDSKELGGNYLAKMAAKTGDGGDAAGGRVVLVVRGALFDRYPNAHVYAAKGVAVGGEGDLERRPDLPEPTPAGSSDDGEPGTVKHPIFRGTLDPDVTFFGFDLTEAEAAADPGWFFVIEEPPSGPSFGLDVAVERTESNDDWTWEDLTWDDVTANGYVSVGQDPAGDDVPGTLPTDPTWRRNGAHMGAITWNRPFRAAIHADDMLPTTGGSE